jgi:hypothetical protein
MEARTMNSPENEKLKNNARLAENNSNNTKNERDSIMENKENKLVENKPENSVKTGTTSVQSMTLEEAIRIFKSSKPKEKALEDAPKSTEVPEKDAENTKMFQLKIQKKVKKTMKSAIKNHQRSINSKREKVEILLGVRKSQSLDH